MSENKMRAELRVKFGKGAARKLRAAGKTPAVIYGHGSETRHIALPAHEVALALRIKNALLDLDIEGTPQLVLVKSAQKDPVHQVIEHVDLVEIRKGEKVNVDVPVHIIGEPLSGTVVDLVHNTVTLQAEATSIPENIELHISKEAAAGHHYLVSDLQVPAGSVLELAADELIATVSETKQAHAEELATDAEGAAGEAAAEGDSSESAESAE
jgi:large subunit ribosomal protein L25